jgi:hypothetical protein
MTRYYKATDGKFTVFRHSNTCVYSTARMRIVGDSVTEIGFYDKSHDGEPGSYRADKIKKAEYEDLVLAKIDRRRRLNDSLSVCDREASQSWLRNSDLPNKKDETK